MKVILRGIFRTKDINVAHTVMEVFSLRQQESRTTDIGLRAIAPCPLAQSPTLGHHTPVSPSSQGPQKVSQVFNSICLHTWLLHLSGLGWSCFLPPVTALSLGLFSFWNGYCSFRSKYLCTLNSGVLPPGASPTWSMSLLSLPWGSPLPVAASSFMRVAHSRVDTGWHL